MQPFSSELLTILVIVSLSLASLTFITVLILSIISIHSYYSKRRQIKLIKPIETQSVGSTLSIDDPSPINSPPTRKTPIRTTNQQKKSERNLHYYDRNNTMNDHSYLNNKNKYQQQIYKIDENDETLTTINDNHQIYDQHQKKQQYQSIKPMTDIRILDRHTPYPPDVIAREKFMNNNRFPMNNKY